MSALSFDLPQLLGGDSVGNDPDFPGVITGGTDTTGMFPGQSLVDVVNGNPLVDNGLSDLFPDIGRDVMPGGGGPPMPIDGRGFDRSTLSPVDNFESMFDSNPAFID